MNNAPFVSLYHSLTRKLAFDIQDKTAMRSVRIIPNALGRKQAPIIVCEAVSQGAAIYDGYYPIDEATYCEALPRCGVLRFNQTNLFNNQMENRMKRQFTCGLDWRDEVCCLYGILTLAIPPDDTQGELERLFQFMDIFASCLGIWPIPVSLAWYRSEESEFGRGQTRANR